jgi:hypothetical protein
VVSIARIGRPPFYRGGPASTETTPAISFGSRALSEHRRSSGSIPSLLLRIQKDNQATLAIRMGYTVDGWDGEG